jgi:ribonuclease BN (tRNA processing enzyme)
MQLTVLGTSPSFPNPGKATSGYLLEESDTCLLVDCGHGVTSVLLSVLDPRQLTGIVISHMHADHFLDLVPLHYAYRFQYRLERPLPLWLPPDGVAILDRVIDVLGLDARMFADMFTVREYVPGEPLILGSVRINFAPTTHFIDAYGMRFSGEEGAGHIGYSSDTAPDERVVGLLRGVELALVEATEVRYAEPGEGKGHLTARLAGELAREAGVERLLLVHYPESMGEEIAAEASKGFGKAAELARQGRSYTV